MCIINLEDVLELGEGGEVFGKIIEKTKLNEAEDNLHFLLIASTMKYLHFKKICHRDTVSTFPS